ncbi:sigma-70 family RNA polymerase sigma factor [Parapedobacter sp. SGR-10]|uniref:RNA polymerase sigma factor n=1 Tax=Parapedobacter sp. SGR-10 TaxID=2710879 RepID=UPI0013D11DC7|nr:sigma-70 family RNA polymerase sigma factor [Parapedobacter sp. SGR-10]NGF55946.1 sigma-70 family RNA polymerase sigma factor [Parapedobacter sp. SGR-10]
MIVNLSNELVVKFQQGDTLAFKQLFESFSRQMLYVAQNIVKDSQVADEILSDGFLKLWEARDQFHTINSVKAYLYVVIRNASLNHVQAARQRIDHKPLDEKTLIGEPEALANILRAELFEAIRQELKHLTPKQAAVFQMSVIEGKETDEICKALDISPGSVFTHRSAAIKAIRKALREKHQWILLLYFSQLFS